MRLLRSRTTGNVIVLALLGLWFVTLAPTAVKGPAAYIEVVGHSMDGTYLTGDLVITRQQDSYEKGDIIAFQVGRDGSGGQVIHRVIGGNGVKGYRTQGDNNPDPDPWRPTDADVVGKAWIHLDQKAFLLHLPRNPTFAGIAAGLVTLLVLGLDARPKRRQDADPEMPVRTGSEAEDAVLVSSVGAQSASSEPAAVPSQRVPSHEQPHVNHRGQS